MVAEQLLQLLNLCAQLQQSDELSSRIQRESKHINIWADLPSIAEEQGMAPLVNYHLRKAGVVIPQETQRELTALALRHKLINQVRTSTLLELTPKFQQADIPFLVLKGLALAHLLYPSPDLRPMKDMDFLVRPEDCDSVTRLMIENGFVQKIDNFFHPSELHLPTFSKEMDGFSISIEIHHRLLPIKNGEFWGYLEKIKLPYQKFSLSNDVIVETISKEEFLYHLCKHTFFSYHNLEPMKMIWVADICNFSEKFMNAIDWEFIQSNFPIVQHTLAALHEIFPLSDKLLKVGNINPSQFGEKNIRTYQGWPGIPLRDVKKQDYWQWLKDTVFPSGWVLFLYYGNGPYKAKWNNWLKHIENLLAITKQHMKIRFNTKNN